MKTGLVLLILTMTTLGTLQLMDISENLQLVTAEAPVDNHEDSNNSDNSLDDFEIEDDVHSVAHLHSMSNSNRVYSLISRARPLLIYLEKHLKPPQV